MSEVRYVDANGINTRYIEAGNGDPLVLVHGGSFGSHWNAEDWELNIERLARHFHVYAFDKIGQGFSDDPTLDEDYVIGTTVGHAHDFITALDLGPVHIAGHSRGGYTVTRLALEHPEVVKTLIIVSSSSLMTPPNPQYDIWERESRRIEDPRERYRYLITSNSYSDAHITPRYLDVVIEIESLPKTQAAKARLRTGLDERFKADLVERQPETHAWIRAGGITCPTLVVWGFEDPSATMQRCGIPCMQLILPSVDRSEMHILNRAGHSCFRERPEAFESAVTDFIRRHH